MKQIIYFFGLTSFLFFNHSSLSHESVEQHLHKLNESIQNTSDEGSLYIEQGRSLMELNQYTQANQSFRKALKIDANEYYQARYYLAESLLLSGDVATAEKTAREYLLSVATFNKIIQSNANLLLADILSKQEKFGEAVIYYQQAFSLGSSFSPDAYLRYANGLVKTDQKGRASSLLLDGIQKLGAPVALTNAMDTLILSNEK